MTAEKNKLKKSGLINSGNLLIRCRARQMSVADLARRINRSRQAVYYAVENPTRYSPTFALIVKHLL